MMHTYHNVHQLITVFPFPCRTDEGFMRKWLCDIRFFLSLHAFMHIQQNKIKKKCAWQPHVKWGSFVHFIFLFILLSFYMHGTWIHWKCRVKLLYVRKFHYHMMFWHFVTVNIDCILESKWGSYIQMIAINMLMVSNFWRRWKTYVIWCEPWQHNVWGSVSANRNNAVWCFAIVSRSKRINNFK